MFLRSPRDAQWTVTADEPAARDAAGSWWGFHVATAEFGLATGYTRRDVEIAFRRLASKAHPDVGGTQEAFQTLVEKRDLLLNNAIF
jgi:hypothetical protein